MDEINKRIRVLRKELDLSQEAFGKILGITKSGVCDIESGRRKVTESHIIMLKNYGSKTICEEWLRYGDGEPFKSFPSVMANVDFGNDEFIKDFVEVYMSLDENAKNALKEIMYKMSKKHSIRGREG